MFEIIGIPFTLGVLIQVFFKRAVVGKEDQGNH